MASSPERWQKLLEKQHLQRRIDLLSLIDIYQMTRKPRTPIPLIGLT